MEVGGRKYGHMERVRSKLCLSVFVYKNMTAPGPRLNTRRSERPSFKKLGLDSGPDPSTGEENIVRTLRAIVPSIKTCRL